MTSNDGFQRESIIRSETIPALEDAGAPSQESDLLAIKRFRASHRLARRAELGRSLLLHGALAEREGRGVILAGPSNIGKTTACGRLVAPWFALSDDATLVSIDPGGSCSARPWHSWKVLFEKDFAAARRRRWRLPLAGIFFLERGERDRAQRIGSGRAACMILESNRQLTEFVGEMTLPAGRRGFFLHRLENACVLAKSVPCFLLGITLTGSFWEEMETVLGWGLDARSVDRLP